MPTRTVVKRNFNSLSKPLPLRMEATEIVFTRMSMMQHVTLFSLLVHLHLPPTPQQTPFMRVLLIKSSCLSRHFHLNCCCEKRIYGRHQMLFSLACVSATNAAAIEALKTTNARSVFCLHSVKTSSAKRVHSLTKKKSLPSLSKKKSNNSSKKDFLPCCFFCSFLSSQQQFFFHSHT